MPSILVSLVYETDVKNKDMIKNKFALATSLSFLIVATLGCGLADRLTSDAGNSSAPASGKSNKSLEDRAIDTAVGEEKIGIPECDEVFAMIAKEMDDPNDGYLVKAGKAVVLNKIKENIRTSIEQNKNDKQEMAKTCADYKKQVENFRAEEEKK